ncbi:MAG: C40 family peptidase [Treponemataceae bacterium]|nr:C40 family peptidase [Treponemataceae bacterium]
MKYDDLLNVPYKKFGNGLDGINCWYAVFECCRRAGTPLRDIFSDLEHLPAEEVNDYINKGLNVREIPTPKVGALVYSVYRGNAHVGYIVERGKVLHATFDKGVKISPIEALHPIAYYEVVDESKHIQNTIEQTGSG